jgi:NitT/TauT family transport system substrate-binding protein
MPDVPPVDSVITGQFIDQINIYDRASVIADAKKEDLGKLGAK